MGDEGEVLGFMDPDSLMQRILIVENSFRPGVGAYIARLVRNESNHQLESLVIDADEVAATLNTYQPDIVILDVDSLQHAQAIDVAMVIREQNSELVIMFGSDRVNPILVKEGMLAALWSRAYWLNQPSKNPTLVIAEIQRAFSGKKPLHQHVLESAASETSHIGRLTPQQHRVMRLMALGASNAKIGREYNMTTKAVERTISAASILLGVESSTPDNNHRVLTAITYRRFVLFADVFGVE
jgi:DNA-binding NarL/FixJ family response regulator